MVPTLMTINSVWPLGRRRRMPACCRRAVRASDRLVDVDHFPAGVPQLAGDALRDHPRPRRRGRASSRPGTARASSSCAEHCRLRRPTGAIVWTRTPIGSPSRAADRPNRLSPALAAPYAAKPGNGSRAAADETFTTTPPRCRSNAGQAARRQVERAPTGSCRSRRATPAATSPRSTGPARAPRCSRPRRSGRTGPASGATSRSTCAGSVTSVGTARAACRRRSRDGLVQVVDVPRGQREAVARAARAPPRSRGRCRGRRR